MINPGHLGIIQEEFGGGGGGVVNVRMDEPGRTYHRTTRHVTHSSLPRGVTLSSHPSPSRPTNVPVIRVSEDHDASFHSSEPEQITINYASPDHHQVSGGDYHLHDSGVQGGRSYIQRGRSGATTYYDMKQMPFGGLGGGSYHYERQENVPMGGTYYHEERRSMPGPGGGSYYHHEKREVPITSDSDYERNYYHAGGPGFILRKETRRSTPNGPGHIYPEEMGYYTDPEVYQQTYQSSSPRSIPIRTSSTRRVVNTSTPQTHITQTSRTSRSGGSPQRVRHQNGQLQHSQVQRQLFLDEPDFVSGHSGFFGGGAGGGSRSGGGGGGGRRAGGGYEGGGSRDGAVDFVAGGGGPFIAGGGVGGGGSGGMRKVNIARQSAGNYGDDIIVRNRGPQIQDDRFLREVQDELEEKRHEWKDEVEKMTEGFVFKESPGGGKTPIKTSGANSYVDTSGGRPIFKAFINVQDYSANNINVTVDKITNKIVVTAKKDAVPGALSQTFTQKVALPQYADDAHVRSKLSRDGVLSIEVPLLYYFEPQKKKAKSFINQIKTNPDGSQYIEILVNVGSGFKSWELKVELHGEKELRIVGMKEGSETKKTIKRYHLPKAANTEKISSHMGLDSRLIVVVPLIGHPATPDKMLYEYTTPDQRISRRHFTYETHTM